ncbi:prepilin-type N-terminal cleavage/methylation domain-containing protein [Candidatus Parcubacteria bacterium]|nr:prepilin-type N-terminal cleavage/methylation domain-containing protein [Candidatus Parcubacteria bacterium]
MRKNNKLQKGFTLIELLVAIAIIGILANLILINFKDSKKKAEIAKVLQWSNSSIYHMLGANSMGVWKFNGNLNDASGNRNSCSITGDAGYVSGVAGQGLEFDGTGDYVSCPDDDSLDPINEATIEAWIYLRNSGAGSQIIVSKSDSNYSVKYNSATGKIDFVLFCNTISSDSAISSNSWTHIAAIKGASDEMRLYINGEKQLAVNSCSHPLQSATPLYIGGDGTNDFEGIIDEVRIYSEGFSENIAREHYLKGELTHR